MGKTGFVVLKFFKLSNIFVEILGIYHIILYLCKKQNITKKNLTNMLLTYNRKTTCLIMRNRIKYKLFFMLD